VGGVSRYSDLPQVQALGDGGTRSTTQMVVIHATDNATASAEGEASYATRRTDKVSAHFYVDNDSTVQALDTTHIAWGCYSTSNNRSVQFELCGLSNKLSDATMRQAARTVARVCREFGLPIRKLSSADLRAGTRGICGHADVTAAWLQGDHTDPGNTFPWTTFLTYVQAAASGQTVEADEMNAAQEQLLRDTYFWARAAVTGRDTTGKVVSDPYDGASPVGNRQVLEELAKLGTAAPAVDTDALVDQVVERITPALPTAEQIALALMRQLLAGQQTQS